MIYKSKTNERIRKIFNKKIKMKNKIIISIIILLFCSINITNWYNYNWKDYNIKIPENITYLEYLLYSWQEKKVNKKFAIIIKINRILISKGLEPLYK